MRALRQNHRTPWEVNDISLSASYILFRRAVADIKFSGSLGLTFPFKKAVCRGSHHGGEPGVHGWGIAGFSVGLSAGYSYFLNDEATVAVDCDRAPYNCVVSGNDTAIPNALHNISGGLRLGYQILEQLGVSASYRISRGMRAVEFEVDDRSSQYAQGGNQWGLERHSFSTGISYRHFSKTSLSFRMTTGNSLYTQDNSEVQLPFYDGSLRQAFRTTYSIGLSRSL